jgi:thiol-disulfide isomerase/thioredoxin
MLIAVGMKAQPCNKTFTLQGKIDRQTGTAFLVPLNDNKDYPAGKLPDSAEITNGTFTFSGSICYPYGFMLVVRKNSANIYISDVFIIEPGAQSITCHADSLRRQPFIQNSSMKELNRYMGPLQAMHLDEMKRIDRRAKNDIYLLDYAKGHPGSYIALWKLTERLGSAYATILDSIYFYLADSLKNTHTGKSLGDKLRSAGKYAVGKPFPQLMLSDRGAKKEWVPSFGSDAKYILIDFWFAHCSACISLFPALKTIYNKYQAKGFDVVGISIDHIEYIDDWKKAITDNQLPWRQYLDLNGKEADALSVQAYPWNFLLDSKGKIIAIDIETSSLDAFLQTNIK